eukprot:s428_g15.t1
MLAMGYELIQPSLETGGRSLQHSPSAPAFVNGAEKQGSSRNQLHTSSFRSAPAKQRATTPDSRRGSHPGQEASSRASSVSSRHREAPVHIRLYQEKDDRRRRLEQARLRQLEKEEEDDLRVAAQKALGRQPSPSRRRDPSPGPGGSESFRAAAGDHTMASTVHPLNRGKPPVPVRHADSHGRSKPTRKSADGPNAKFLSLPQGAAIETSSVGSHEGGPLGQPSVTSVGTGVEDSSFCGDAGDDEVHRLQQQVASQQQRFRCCLYCWILLTILRATSPRKTDPAVTLNAHYEAMADTSRELLCPMKDAAEEEMAAGINRLKEGDFGSDLPLVLRACGFTQLELPTFDAEQLQSEEVMALSASIVANPRNFDAWISLMKLVEASGTDGEKCELYEHFLSEFPLCWGYWKRLADLQTRTCGAESGLNVYVKALKLAPACVDLWVHYCQAAYVAASDGEDGLRELFEKAVDTVGSDWRAFPLWDLYMNFEEKNRCWKRLGFVLRRAMVVPMEGLPAVRIRLRALVVGDAAPPLEELCCDDAESNRLDVEMRTQSYDPQVMTISLAEHVAVAPVVSKPPVAPVVAPPAAAAVESDEELEEGELVEEGEIVEDEPSPPDAAPPSELEKPETPVPPVPLSASPEPAPEPAAEVDDPKNMKTPEKKTKFITDRAQRFLQMREELWAAASEEASLLRTFEAPLHRHYFHQKPLSSAQLDAWRRFLDFEESREPRNWRRLQGLFERCLIVTNNYLEFWLRYASVLEQAEAAHGQNKKPEISCGLLRGACLSGRLSRRPDALAAWAELEESCGRVDRARVLLDATLSGCGHGSSDLALRRASLELRDQDAELAAVLLDRYANDAVDLASKAILSRRYARLCEERLHQVDKACQSLLATWQAGCRDLGLLLELTSLLMRFSRAERKGSTGPPSLQQSCLLFEEALRCLANEAAVPAASALAEACELWSCYVDFLLANGAPLSQLRDVQARARAFRSQASVRKADAENKKRGYALYAV